MSYADDTALYFSSEDKEDLISRDTDFPRKNFNISAARFSKFRGTTKKFRGIVILTYIPVWHSGINLLAT